MIKIALLVFLCDALKIDFLNFTNPFTILFRDIAQLLEYSSWVREVAGSSPFIPTILQDIIDSFKKQFVIHRKNIWQTLVFSDFFNSWNLSTYS